MSAHSGIFIATILEEFSDNFISIPVFEISSEVGQISRYWESCFAVFFFQALTRAAMHHSRRFDFWDVKISTGDGQRDKYFTNTNISGVVPGVPKKGVLKLFRKKMEVNVYLS